MLNDLLFELISLDVRSLIAVLFWGNLTAIFLLFSYRVSSDNPLDQKLLRYFFAAKLIQALAYFFLFFRYKLPDLLSVHLGNTLLMAGFYMESMAMLVLIQENKRLHKINLVIGVGAVSLFNIWEFKYHDNALRVATASLCVFLVLIIPSIKLMLSGNSSRFKKIIGFNYIFFVLLLIPRTIHSAIHKETTLFTNNFVHSLTFLSLILLMVFSLSAYMLLLKENADNIIHSMAKYDQLTGLQNRASFLETVSIQYENCRRGQRWAGLLFLDIDHFKKINDTYGHTFGDKVLKAFADVLKSCTRDTDYVCRYGGEEFLIFTAQNDDATSSRIARRIMAGVENITFKELPDFHFTVSIGIICGLPPKEGTLQKYIDQADSALYQAKSEGRNRIVERKTV